MKPLMFDPADGSLTRVRSVGFEDNLLQSRNVSNPRSKGKYPDPRPDYTTAKEHAQVAVVPNTVACARDFLLRFSNTATRKNNKKWSHTPSEHNPATLSVSSTMTCKFPGTQRRVPLPYNQQAHQQI